MKARISNGILYLERQGQFQIQRCPFSAHTPQQPCGQWCPLFGEPYMVNYAAGIQGWTLTLCRASLRIEAFEGEDKRPIQHLPDTGFEY